MKRFITEELRRKRIRAGILGGNATFARYGREQMGAWGEAWGTAGKSHARGT